MTQLGQSGRGKLTQGGEAPREGSGDSAQTRAAGEERTQGGEAAREGGGDLGRERLHGRDVDHLEVALLDDAPAHIDAHLMGTKNMHDMCALPALISRCFEIFVGGCCSSHWHVTSPKQVPPAAAKSGPDVILQALSREPKALDNSEGIPMPR